MSDVVYLYGLVPADAPAPPPELAGVAGSPVRLVQVGAFAAVIAELPAEYRAEQIEARLGDIAWVGEQGLAHERVVLWFVDHTDILPARLFSLHADQHALRAALEPQMPVIERSLIALAGRREWNLKIACDAAALGRHGSRVSAELRSMDEQIESAPPGRRYLLERQRGELLKREVASAARRLADELLDALRQYSDAVRILPLADTDEDGTVVMTAALLVHRDTEPTLRAEADRRIRDLQELGMIVSFSGPWAPYRFTEDHVDA